MCSTKHFKSITISFQCDTGPQPNTYYHRQVDQLCTGSAPVCLVQSTAQWNRREQKRREHLLTTRAAGPRDYYQRQIPKSSAPRIAIVLLSPSPALGMGSFYFWGFFLASIKIVVWFWLGRFWLTDKPIWKKVIGKKERKHVNIKMI